MDLLSGEEKDVNHQIWGSVDGSAPRFDLQLYMLSVRRVFFPYSKGSECLSAQPSSSPGRRGRTVWAVAESCLLVTLLFLHCCVKGRRTGSAPLSLHWLVCKARIWQFVSQDQISSLEWNRLSFCTLCSLRAVQCDIARHLQDSGLYHKYSLAQESFRMGLRANSGLKSLFLWLPGNYSGREGLDGTPEHSDWLSSSPWSVLVEYQLNTS